MTEDITHWESLRRGNIQALEALYNAYAGTLYSYGMMIAKDEDKVKDAIHDLFVYLWQVRDKISTPNSTKAYLLVSLRRRLLDKGTGINKMTVSMEDLNELKPVTAGPEDLWIGAEQNAINAVKLQNAIQSLSLRQQEIIHMRYFQQLEYEEIGRILDMNYQSARNLLTRAISALRKEMLPMVIILLILL